MESKDLNREDLKYYAKLATETFGWVAGQIEVTTVCFQKCLHCHSKVSGKQRHMSISYLLNVLASMVSAFPMFRHLTLTGGDPQAWRYLTAFLEHWCVDSQVKLQISTAMTQDLTYHESILWRKCVADLGVSIDAVTTPKYQHLRGDLLTLPAEVFERLKTLQHPKLAFIVTMYEENIADIYRRSLSKPLSNSTIVLISALRIGLPSTGLIGA